jgi:oxygen-independent coproporphyrinogen-3 oxidase
VYLHVPFCSAICSYCNFNRGLADAVLQRRYVEALRHEIAAYADGSPVDTIYFGGGTPSLLAPSEVAGLLDACAAAFTVQPDAEITLEANPESATFEHLRDLARAGVNRLSLGVQSFDDGELARLGRLHSADDARRAYSNARRAGFENVSLDLMMWLPGQDVQAWLRNVEALIALEPEHASLYLLEIYPNSPLRDDMARQGWQSAPDEVAADMYLDGLARLDAAGYVQYEISNVARHGRFSRHNVKYWTDGEWLGLGCGAHGTRARVRWRNVPGTVDYVAAMATGRSVRAEERHLSPADALAEAAFMGLRLSGGVDVRALDARYGCDMMSRFGGELARCAAAGLLEIDRDGVRLTRGGMLLANEVLAVFV